MGSTSIKDYLGNGLHDFKLEPCPFCGCAVKMQAVSMGHGWWYGVQCRSTHGHGGDCAMEQVPSRTIEAAAKRWNMRRPVEALRAEVEILRRDAGRYRWLRNPERSAAELDSVFDSYGLPMDEKIDAAMVKAKNEGHGHVFPRPDGVRARCGGPGLCKVCSADAAKKALGN